MLQLSTTTRRRAGLALLPLLILVVGACERNADGSFSVDQAYLCVRTGDGDIRWTADRRCGAGEILIRVDEAQGLSTDPGPEPSSWTGIAQMGVTTPTVSADGAATSLVQLTAEETLQMGPNARCDLVVEGTTTAHLGETRTWGIGDVANSTIEWADPEADNGVAVRCEGQSGFTDPITVNVALVPVG